MRNEYLVLQHLSHAVEVQYEQNCLNIWQCNSARLCATIFKLAGLCRPSEGCLEGAHIPSEVFNPGFARGRHCILHVNRKSINKILYFKLCDNH